MYIICRCPLKEIKLRKRERQSEREREREREKIVPSSRRNGCRSVGNGFNVLFSAVLNFIGTDSSDLSPSWQGAP